LLLLILQFKIAPGQTYAFYENDKLLGGGIIKEQVVAFDSLI
jgi:tRNA U34 2-thiouridine synthase MnmA/TrmU